MTHLDERTRWLQLFKLNLKQHGQELIRVFENFKLTQYKISKSICNKLQIELSPDLLCCAKINVKTFTFILNIQKNYELIRATHQQIIARKDDFTRTLRTLKQKSSEKERDFYKCYTEQSSKRLQLKRKIAKLKERLLKQQLAKNQLQRQQAKIRSQLQLTRQHTTTLQSLVRVLARTSFDQISSFQSRFQFPRHRLGYRQLVSQVLHNQLQVGFTVLYPLAEFKLSLSGDMQVPIQKDKPCRKKIKSVKSYVKS